MIAIATKPILAFTETNLIPASDGSYAVVWPPGSDTILSVTGSGGYETRPKDAKGTNETFRRSGDKLVCSIPEGVFVIPFVEY